jgi:prolyl-tRNA synthetase
LQDIQQSMYNDALKFREENSRQVNTYNEFKDVLENQLGFLYAHWCGSEACEQAIQDDTKATIRCIPFDQQTETGTCVYCGKPSQGRVPFAKAY